MITYSGTLRWLKLAHIICAAVWLGCSAALNVMRFCVSLGNLEELPGYSYAILVVDTVLIYWGAIGILAHSSGLWLLHEMGLLTPVLDQAEMDSRNRHNPGRNFHHRPRH